MPQYRYNGRKRTGEKMEGVITAQTRSDAIRKLRNLGVAYASLEEIEPTFLRKEIYIGKPVKHQDFIMFLRQFSTLLKSGVTIVDSISILSQQTNSKPLMRALENIEEQLRNGKSLSEAAASEEKIFPPIFINMVRAGEASGNIDGALDELTVQFEKQFDTRQKVKSAMTYPIIVGIVSIAVVIFLLTSVVPMFASMLTDLGGELPLITRIVLGASNIVSSTWWLLMLIAILFVLVIAVLRSRPETKYYVDYAMLKMPVFGQLLQKSVMARMSRTLSSLFSSAVPIIQSIQIVEKIVGNEVVKKTLQEARDALEEGNSLTTPMKNNWVFPPLVVQMIRIGENTGSLDQMLEKVAFFYEKEVEYATDRMKAMIEPMLIVFLAVIVGTIVISIIVPMFQIYGQI